MGLIEKGVQYVGFDARPEVQKHVVGGHLLKAWNYIFVGCWIWCLFVIDFANAML
jgi:hypothetical protein